MYQKRKLTIVSSMGAGNLPLASYDDVVLLAQDSVSPKHFHLTL